MAKGQIFESLMNHITPAIEAGKKSALLQPYAERVEHARAELIKGAQHVSALAGSQDFMLGFLKATPLLEVFGDVLCAWQLLWQATIAEEKLNAIVGGGDVRKAVKENNEAAFLDGKIKSARHFIGMELPKVDGKILTLLVNESAAIEIDELSFT
jgi:hypothetical protein